MDEPKDPGHEALQADGPWHVVLPSGRLAQVQEAKAIPLAEIDKSEPSPLPPPTE